MFLPPIKNWSFEDLMEFCTAQLFNALIEGGTKEMKTRMFIVYNVICQWQDAKDN